MTDHKFAATPRRVIGKEGDRQSIGFFFEPNLHSTVKLFTKEPSPTRTAPQDSYAALLLQTFAEREAKQKEMEQKKFIKLIKFSLTDKETKDVRV